MIDKVDILGILIDRVDMGQALDRIEEFIKLDTSNLVVTPNAEMIIRATKDPKLREIINSAQLIVPDGAGVILAANLLGQPLSERVAGIDLVKELLAQANQKDYSFYFLGSAPGVANKAKEKVLKKWPKLTIIAHHGYLDRELEEQVIDEIKKEEIDILLVGMGVPLQEKWLATYLDQLDIPVGIGVGGTFDILAGNKKRAPEVIQGLNLEWLYRLLQEPKRLGRMTALPEFIYKVLHQRLK
ncbi:WecB/TagA/CpsF family glycosyltransferase [Halobacteroides halobius]|nr:WecB/TagA/CpsF family glycosyltransferase [Halobacteroides halobius]